MAHPPSHPQPYVQLNRNYVTCYHIIIGVHYFLTAETIPFCSHPHQRYSRLDYLFISQRDLPMLHQASVDPMFLSDHHSISIYITFLGVPTRPPTWRLDPSLQLPLFLQTSNYISIDIFQNTTPLKSLR